MMVSVRIKSVILILFLSLYFMVDIHGEDIQGNGRSNYLVLKKMYEKWDVGLFGSRKLYRNRLYRLLTDMIGTEIVTGQDYKISIPDNLITKHYSSDIYGNKWLHIHGAADSSSIKALTQKGDDYIKEVERNRHLFFLSGRIEKFRIVETGYGGSVHLYLESVKILESVKGTSGNSTSTELQGR